MFTRRARLLLSGADWQNSAHQRIVALKPSASNGCSSSRCALYGSKLAGGGVPLRVTSATRESGDSKVCQRCDGVAATNLRRNDQLENVDAGQFNLMLFGLGVGALRVEVPLLTHDLME